MGAGEPGPGHAQPGHTGPQRGHTLSEHREQGAQVGSPALQPQGSPALTPAVGGSSRSFRVPSPVPAKAAVLWLQGCAFRKPVCSDYRIFSVRFMQENIYISLRQFCAPKGK